MRCAFDSFDSTNDFVSFVSKQRQDVFCPLDLTILLVVVSEGFLRISVHERVNHVEVGLLLTVRNESHKS